MNERALQSGGRERYRVHSRFYSPPEEFDGCFTSFYQLRLEVEDGGAVCDHLQPEWGNIRFFGGSAPWVQIPGGTALSGAHFTGTGPSSLPAKFELGPVKMWGIGLLPLGWARFMDVEARALANMVVDGAQHPAFRKFGVLCEILCDESCSDEEQLAAIVETMRSLARPHRDEAKVIRVHRALVDTKLTTVAEFSDRAGMSIRTLERLCRRYFGFSPKLLMRRQRFMRSLTEFLLHRGSKWTDVMDEHYHDQAQFSREFREFMTMNPSEYAALDHPILSSFVEARSRIWGSAAQTLDRPD
ncbi:helix-turn-helix domain-containing protein [Altererythrobacter sp.]|uniref:helix-turn-helix domain-containing protein n=1 Tax=Altererythrobacter sp. TaxID=1872480 RepID=UPI003CFC62EA